MRITLIALLLTATAAPAKDSTPSCRASWNLVGACFSVHGRLERVSRKPGEPVTARIVETGTGRIFGVLGTDWSASLSGDLSGTAKGTASGEAQSAETDFTLCPLTRDTRGGMRLVCIQEAGH